LVILNLVGRIKNRLLLILSCSFLLTGLLGCSTLRRIAEPIAGLVGADKPVPPVFYSGPKALLAVTDFEVRATKASPEVGLNLRDMLLRELSNSKRFNIVEFKPANTAKETEKTAGREITGESSAAEQKDKVKTADLIVAVVVNDFEPQISGGRDGLGGGGGVGSGILGGLLGQALKKAYLIFEIRIVDAASSSVLATNRIHGQASDITREKSRAEFDRISLIGGLSSYSETPIEKAIRMCIIETVRYLTESIPPSYYKY